MMNYIRETLEIHGSVQLQAATDIIATSPWVRGHGELPHRIVLRDDGNTFIIHTQVADMACGQATKAYFEGGSYFRYGRSRQPARDEALAFAWKRFETRSRVHLGLE